MADEMKPEDVWGILGDLGGMAPEEYLEYRYCGEYIDRIKALERQLADLRGLNAQLDKSLRFVQQRLAEAQAGKVAVNMLALGSNTYVDAAEIIGIFEIYNGAVKFALSPFELPECQCAVLLRNGMFVPAYVTAKTVLKRLEEAAK